MKTKQRKNRARNAAFLALMSAPLAPIIPALAAPAANASITQSETVTLQLHNVKPSVIAWWLDPPHHEAPWEWTSRTIFSASDSVVAPSTGFIVTNNTKPECQEIPGRREEVEAWRARSKNVQLPTGISKITANDLQNTLLVQGTPQSITQVRETVAKLDVAQVQFELEAKFIKTTVREANALLPGSLPEGEQPVVVREVAFLERLQTSQTAGRAKIVNNPRATTFDGLPTSLRSMTTRTTMLKIGGLPESGAGAPLLKTTTSVGFDVTPTSSAGGAVVLQFNEPLQSRVALAIEGQEGELPINKAAPEQLFSVTQRADEAVLVRGLRQSKLTHDGTQKGATSVQKPSGDDDEELLLVLTARIIRHNDR